MRVTANPHILEVAPGQTSTLTIEIHNPTDRIDAYDIRILGVDPAWVHLDQDQLSLFPESEGTVTAVLDVPDPFPAGLTQLVVEVISQVNDRRYSLIEVGLEVVEQRAATIRADPGSVTAGNRASYSLLIANLGNDTSEFSVSAADDEDAVDVEYEPESVELRAGEQGVITARVKARRPLIGSPKTRMVTFRVNDLEPAPETLGIMTQRPYISRGLLSLFGLLAALTVFGIVLNRGVGEVVDASRVDRALIEQALSEEDAEAAAARANPASIQGAATSATGGPAASINVELFTADDGTTPVRSTVTDETGTYGFGGLRPGTYKIRFVGAGFLERWFANAFTFEQATEVELELGQAATGLETQLGGEPGTVAGRVVADDPSGGQVALKVPGRVTGSGVDATVLSVSLDASGEFLLEEVPAPARYDLVVTKEGFATDTRPVTVGVGETIEDIEVVLRKGDGRIAGRVQGPDGPLGGVTIIATDGITTLQTTSLTEEGSIGAFSIRDLPTPARYSLTFSRDGFASQTLTVSLGPAQQVTNLTATLPSAQGLIAGVVEVDGARRGGVFIEATDGTSVFTTRSLTTGSGRGTFQLANLPLPGTYTVTFRAPGLASQTRAVDLDPLRRRTVDLATVTMSRSQFDVAGRVSIGSTANPVGGVTVTLRGTDLELTTLTADAPAGSEGRFRFTGVPSGSYTLTSSRTGAVPTTANISVASADLDDDYVLRNAGSISGTIFNNGTPQQGAVVTVYRADDFDSLPTATFRTGPDGRYSFATLSAPEDYVVEVRFPADSQSRFTRAVSLQAEEDIRNLDFDVGGLG